MTVPIRTMPEIDAETVEIAAKAIHGAGFFPTLISWEECAEAYREEQRIRARAALEAVQANQ